MSVFYWTIAGYIVVGGGGVGGGRDRRDETQSESYRFVGFRTMYPSAKEFFFVGFNYCKLFCGSDISWHDLPEEPGSSFSFRLVSTLISSEAVSPFQVCFFGAKNMAIPSSTACIESSACIFPDCWRRPPMLLWVCGVCLNFFIFFLGNETHEPGDETYEPKMVIVSSRVVPSTGCGRAWKNASENELLHVWMRHGSTFATPAALAAFFQTWEVKRWDCWLSTEGSHPFVKTEGVSCDEKGAEYLYMVNCGQRRGGGPLSEALINASLGVPYGTGPYRDGWRQTA